MLRPLVGIMCCNEEAQRPVQAVATRFVEPVAKYAGAMTVLVPALPDSFEAIALARRLDGLLLTGSRSNVAPYRYGSACSDGRALDERRDEAALKLAGAMIELGKPVFGICRGLQELNVLYGGTLTCALSDHHHAGEIDYEHQFGHRHHVDLCSGGRLAGGEPRRIEVTSVHREGIERLGSGLLVEAVSPEDELIEAFAASDAPVVGVQWHPEWAVETSPEGQRFFGLLADALA